ncbi:hypothetical protein K458DRAFT_119401 [Lentithecium fluviatile CBS 122367]|uniref:Uncharacterized protein n=1 Tax=Lentithecium fluviatile CBS 122367 TaxID=1168545 RepID=A0A6G1IMZ9_9PLEO|nr:hypothetical protein K458DRAFT_119401 [Lentithecium fluviatile CBS 122367]
MRTCAMRWDSLMAIGAPRLVHAGPLISTALGHLTGYRPVEKLWYCSPLAGSCQQRCAMTAWEDAPVTCVSGVSEGWRRSGGIYDVDAPLPGPLSLILIPTVSRLV